MPTDSVTFLFTDIEGSTQLARQFPDAMPAALARHHETVRAAIDAHGGRVFQIVGDAFCAAFTAAPGAARAALDIQQGLARLRDNSEIPVRIRIGVHCGAATRRPDGDFDGYLALATTQRVMSAGHGDQILVSDAARAAIADALPPGAQLRSLGRYRLRGLPQAETLYMLLGPGLPADFPALRVPLASDEQASPLQWLQRDKLIARVHELGALRDYWRRAQARQSSLPLVLLTGEPGIGKTRLAEALMAEAREDGAAVLRGGCYEFEATTPYVPFVEAVRAFARDASPERLRTALGNTAPELARLAPEIEAKLGVQPPNASLNATDERMRLFDNVTRFLRTLAAPGGLLLFLDDLHWADASTLALVLYVARNLRTEPFLMLGNYREGELDRTHPLAAALVEWNRERLAARITLPRFSTSDTSALLAAMLGRDSVSTEFAQVVHRETEGNPFFVEEVVKSLIEQGALYREGDSWQRKPITELAIPQSIKEAIGRRLSRLSHDCADVLQTCAALGKSFQFAELAAARKPGDEDALLDALDEATGAQLVRPQVGESYAFTHDKIRETLLGELSPIRRRRVHGRIAAALLLLYGGSAEAHAADLAYHFVLAGDNAPGLQWSLTAADGAEQLYAHDEALVHLDHAHECAEALNDTARAAEIEAATARVHARRGDLLAAAESFRLALAQTEGAAPRAALKAALGEAYTDLSDERGIALLDEALRELDPKTQAVETVLAVASLGRFHHYRAQHALALSFFERALALAETSDDPMSLYKTYQHLAGVYQHMARFEASREWARRLIALGEQRNNLEAVASGLEYLAEDAVTTGHWREALQFFEREHAVAERIGSRARLVWADTVRIWALHGLGQLRAAAAAGAAAYDEAARIGDTRVTVLMDMSVCMALTDMARDDEARAVGMRALEHADAFGQMLLRTNARHALGYYHIQRGEWDAAVECYDECLALAAGSDNRLAPLGFGGAAAEAQVGAGRPSQGLRMAEEHLALAQEVGSVHAAGWAQRVRGMALAAQRRDADALTALTEAIRLAESSESPIELGRALCQRALVYRSGGAGEIANADLQRARDLFAICEAPRDLGRADDLIRA